MTTWTPVTQLVQFKINKFNGTAQIKRRSDGLTAAWYILPIEQFAENHNGRLNAAREIARRIHAAEIAKAISEARPDLSLTSYASSENVFGMPSQDGLSKSNFLCGTVVYA